MRRLQKFLDRKDIRDWFRETLYICIFVEKRVSRELTARRGSTHREHLDLAHLPIICQDLLHAERRFGDFSLLLSQAGRARVRMCEIESRVRFFARRCFSVLVSQRRSSFSQINLPLKLLQSNLDYYLLTMTKIIDV